MSDYSLWYDPKTDEVLVYEGYILHRGPLFVFKGLIDPSARTHMRERDRDRLRPITEMEVIAWAAKHDR